MLHNTKFLSLNINICVKLELKAVNMYYTDFKDVVAKIH